jgi:hypothetical protein
MTSGSLPDITMGLDRLTQAFDALMNRAPALVFPRARELYLNKYPLDGREATGPMRLFVQREESQETMEPRQIDGEARRIAIVLVRPITLAAVHWQTRAAPPADLLQSYLASWGLASAPLQAQNELWFREGGHQILMPAPPQLHWQREALMPEAHDL